ncbi:DUF1800 domain-containing protein [Parasedimentitalea huanghaiensis]|uniref:DUF1800 family protein n=1 Tax=Parasedimentitalea huanghaiensis TaxID=2682100 RepID=A0A6L6WDY6_9RHOB|nr:DUF1800 domain-containing protein [Zongyanglinia huanghaiensis]MVO16036.1 DUF1800 family protein [Zongyanglinia huanghaiensis]
MAFTPELAEIRFGCGLSPVLPAKDAVEDILQHLAGPDHMATAYPIDSSDSLMPYLSELNALRRKRRKAQGTDAFEELNKTYKAMRRHERANWARWFSHVVLRHSQTRDGFRERLTLFWADHFTAIGKGSLSRQMNAPYVETAIRPHLTGRFSELLVAAVTHPLMLSYLDQNRSVGPGSRAAQRAGKPIGLNENLAREVLELHTLGVDGPYSQQDVRQLAELFTGLKSNFKKGFQFRPNLAEPGHETILGKQYGGGPARLTQIHAVLHDLSVHPATAAHIARKLVVHFVEDTPDPALVDHVAARFRDTGGNLEQVYAALLEHPAAWVSELRNVKPPLDFVTSACRALAVRPEKLQEGFPQNVVSHLIKPMTMMGQKWETPLGPDGWPEEDDAWITPQSLAARIRWAMLAPQHLVDLLPPPETFVMTSLGSFATGPVQFAAGAAETQSEAIGLVLSSPAFQRR